MKRSEFEKMCRNCGYASKSVVEKYCQGKTNFFDSDFEKVFELQSAIQARKQNQSGKWKYAMGVKTTKRYKNGGSDR